MNKNQFYEQIFFVDNIEDFENFNIIVQHIDDYYYIEFKNHISCNIYYIKIKNQYIYSMDENVLADYILSNKFYDALTENQNYIDYFINTSEKTGRKHDGSIRSNHYQEISVIGLYDNVKLYADHFDVVYIDNLFSVPIYDAADIMKQWLERYKKLITKKYKDIVPELSSGLDTRALTYFWRDLKIRDVYTKNDPIEYPLVQQLLTYINPWIKLHIGKRPSYPISLSGKGGDIYAVANRYMPPDFLIYLIGQFHTRQLIFYICPYLDKCFLQIKTDYLKQLKVVLQHLLAKQYMVFPYLSFARKPFIFTKEMNEDAERIIKHWNIKI